MMTTLIERLREGRWSAETCTAAADRIEELESIIADFVKKEADHLRIRKEYQQRIYKLEAELDAIKNQEPVAWMQPYPINKSFYTVHPQSQPTMYAPWTIPLYTNKIGDKI